MLSDLTESVRRPQHRCTSLLADSKHRGRCRHNRNRTPTMQFLWRDTGISQRYRSSWCSKSGSYVYWTVHHLDNWIKRNQLDVTCFIISLFTAQHISDVNTSILRSLRRIWWVISWVVLFWFDMCWCYVVVWLGWCGIRMQAEALMLQPASG